MINNFMPSIYSTKGYFELEFSLGNVTFLKVCDIYKLGVPNNTAGIDQANQDIVVFYI